MKGIEAIKLLYERYKEIENMNDEELLKTVVKIIENSPQEIISIGSPTVTFVPEIVYCRDCIHRPFREYSEIMAPKTAGGYTDYTCPFICPDPYYTQIPDDDFYCKAGETHE